MLGGLRRELAWRCVLCLGTLNYGRWASCPMAKSWLRIGEKLFELRLLETRGFVSLSYDVYMVLTNEFRPEFKYVPVLFPTDSAFTT